MKVFPTRARKENTKNVFIVLFRLVPATNQREEDVEALVRQSLKNLQTDYIDL
jgi:aryl-alcohol dehydrogenase-like predicted oxidoreductase